MEKFATWAPQVAPLKGELTKFPSKVTINCRFSEDCHGWKYTDGVTDLLMNSLPNLFPLIEDRETFSTAVSQNPQQCQAITFCMAVRLLKDGDDYPVDSWDLNVIWRSTSFDFIDDLELPYSKASWRLQHSTDDAPDNRAEVHAKMNMIITIIDIQTRYNIHCHPWGIKWFNFHRDKSNPSKIPFYALMNFSLPFTPIRTSGFSCCHVPAMTSKEFLEHGHISMVLLSISLMPFKHIANLL